MSLSDFFGHVRKFLHVSLWALTAVIILPCVFVANHFFPKWIKWGEDF